MASEEDCNQTKQRCGHSRAMPRCTITDMWDLENRENLEEEDIIGRGKGWGSNDCASVSEGWLHQCTESDEWSAVGWTKITIPSTGQQRCHRRKHDDH
mmetsp:Transcript_91564/g.200713  ORF Transcript_91564/g.200713 Transcript_91564/m.200713 type:complete len:98 (+) Transcript_91564:401-694(+)